MTWPSDAQAICNPPPPLAPTATSCRCPARCAGGAAAKAAGAIIARGLAREEVTDPTTLDYSAQNTLRRNEEDGRAVLLRIPLLGLAAIGVEQDAKPEAADIAGEAASYGFKRGHQTRPASRRLSLTRGGAEGAGPAEEDRWCESVLRKTREDTKQAELIAMLRRKGARPSPRSSRPPAGSRIRCAAPSPAR